MNLQIKCFRCHLQKAPRAWFLPWVYMHMEDIPLNAKGISLKKSDSGMGEWKKNRRHKHYHTEKTTKQKPSESSLCLPHGAVEAATDKSYLHTSVTTTNGAWWRCGPPAFTCINKSPAGRSRAVDFGLESFVVECLPFVCTDHLSHHTVIKENVAKQSVAHRW